MPKSICAIAIHGGAGIRRTSITAKEATRHLAVIKNSLKQSYKCLKAGGSALDAVEAAIVLLEDSPLFNAGRGSVYTTDGTHEMDAAIMDGRTLEAGAIAGLTVAKNPIKVARLVMQRSPHVLLIGNGANAFAKKHGVELADRDYFHVDVRWQQMQRARQSHSLALDHEIPRSELKQEKFGTVGAVALDLSGNLAAATSTGGVTNKMSGRVGDSPIIGAGTYANNANVAVSCTGRGEDFVRHVIAHSLAMRIHLRKESLTVAAKSVLRLLPKDCGGFVAMNNKGQIVMPFNTEGMFRGAIDKTGKLTINCF